MLDFSHATGVWNIIHSRGQWCPCSHFMNAKRVTKRTSSKPIHWITLAARRVLAGEEFNLVMQDLAKDMGLYDSTRFKAVEHELKARVKEESSKEATTPTKRIARQIIKAVREGPDATDRDFFKPPARAETDMTLEKFRSTALEVLMDKQTPVPMATRLEYIKAKGVEFDLNVDDNWLTDLLNEASNGEFERLSRPEPTNTPTAPWGLSSTWGPSSGT